MGLVTQQDPIGIAGGLNLYGYANGDPINFSDPFGLMACPEDEEDEECTAIEAAHAFWQSIAQAGVEEGGASGLAKEVAGNVASTLLDFGGVTAIDDATTTLADPLASGGDKLLAAGQTALVVAGAGVTGKVAATGVRAAGYGSRVAIHGAHHTFGALGRLAHFQVNTWQIGVKGSGRALRIPLPWRW